GLNTYSVGGSIAGKTAEVHSNTGSSTGAGKSATGNSFLREKVFLSSFLAVSITKHCNKGSSTWKGRDVVIVDSPGLFDMKVSDAETRKEITRCMVLTSPGLHALLLVIPLVRYMPKDQKATEKILTMFGERAKEHMIALFKDDLAGMDFRDYLKHAATTIRELIREFRDHYCVVNNKATGAEQENQREQLLLIDKMVQNNQGAYFSDQIQGESESSISRVTWKTNKAYAQDLYHSRRHSESSQGKEIRKLKDELEQQKRKVKMERELAEREAYWDSRQQTARDDVLSQNEIFEFIFKLLEVASHFTIDNWYMFD
uniref:AIG1-type G domain-containing protein n=1 Tax=Capra hircus TaxID=9925 RepID=A0A8C2P8H0_CAPHI